MRGCIHWGFIGALLTSASFIQGLASGEDISKSVVTVAIKSNASSGDVVVLADKSKLAKMNGQQSSATEEKEQKVRLSTLPDSSPGFELAAKNLSELLPVLKHLKKHSPQQYEKAIRDLDRSAKRLEAIKRRDSKLFDISLREWKIRGQVDLLKAKVRVKKSESYQQAILQQLKALRDIELERLNRELALIDERLVANEDRLRQTKQMIDHSIELRKTLNEKRLRLESETIDESSHVFMRAIDNHKNNADTRPAVDRPDVPSKSTSNKVPDENKK